MNINFSNLPLIYDIAPKHLWIPIVAATGCHLIVKLIAKSLPTQEDHFPLAYYRTRLRIRVLDRMELQYPNAHALFRVAIPENIFCSVVIVSVLHLKNSISLGTAGKETSITVLACCVLLSCVLLTAGRTFTAMFLGSASYHCRSSFLTHLLRSSANFISPSNLRERMP